MKDRTEEEIAKEESQLEEDNTQGIITDSSYAMGPYIRTICKNQMNYRTS